MNAKDSERQGENSDRAFLLLKKKWNESLFSLTMGHLDSLTDVWLLKRFVCTYTRSADLTVIAYQLHTYSCFYSPSVDCQVWGGGIHYVGRWCPANVG